MRILPYRTIKNIIDGVVVTFIDITARKMAEQLGESARIYAENIVDTVREPLMILDENLKVVSANRSFYQTFKTSPEETEHMLIYDLGDGVWNISRLRELLEEIIPKRNSFDDFKFTHDFPVIGRKTMLLNARMIEQRSERRKLILLAIEDIPGREQKKASG
jgi:two-component system CheB/CheR fusion protein